MSVYIEALTPCIRAKMVRLDVSKRINEDLQQPLQNTLNRHLVALIQLQQITLEQKKPVTDIEPLAMWQQAPTAEHPLVFRYDDRRKSLVIDPAVDRIVGESRSEPETLHRAIEYTSTERPLLYRVTLSGEEEIK